MDLYASFVVFWNLMCELVYTLAWKLNFLHFGTTYSDKTYISVISTKYRTYWTASILNF